MITMKMCILVRALRACEEYIAFASLSHLLEGHVVCLAGRKLRYNSQGPLECQLLFSQWYFLYPH